MVTRHGVRRALVALAHSVQQIDVTQPLFVRYDVIEELMAEHTRIDDILSSHPVLQHRHELQQLSRRVMSALSEKVLELVDDTLEDVEATLAQIAA
jgi:hypothetical protein